MGAKEGTVQTTATTALDMVDLDQVCTYQHVNNTIIIEIIENQVMAAMVVSMEMDITRSKHQHSVSLQLPQ